MSRGRGFHPAWAAQCGPRDESEPGGGSGIQAENGDTILAEDGDELLEE